MEVSSWHCNPVRSNETYCVGDNHESPLIRAWFNCAGLTLAWHHYLTPLRVMSPPSSHALSEHVRSGLVTHHCAHCHDDSWGWFRGHGSNKCHWGGGVSLLIYPGRSHLGRCVNSPVSPPYTTSSLQNTIPGAASTLTGKPWNWGKRGELSLIIRILYKHLPLIQYIQTHVPLIKYIQTHVPAFAYNTNFI